MRVIGVMVFSMARGNTFLLMDFLEVGSGKMGNELNGMMNEIFSLRENNLNVKIP